MENNTRLLVPEGYIPKEDAAELIRRHPRTLEKIWRRSQRTTVKIRKKLVRPVKGGSSEVAYHRDDLLNFMALKSSQRPGSTVEKEGIHKELAALSELLRSEADRIIAEIRNIKLHIAFGGRKDDGA